LWVTGMFGRGLWTPDEPREADIAWRMSRQSDRTLPQLAGTPFLEKPPLSYWMSGAAISLFGDSAAAERAPNLLYAAVTAVAVGALALAMDTEADAALIAALVAASALTAFRVGVWLAPDACLLAGNALALLGAWRGTRAPPGPTKAAGYTLMHLGAAVGFMAKSAPGWLVPAMALLTLIVWERRWSELRRWELYAGLALQGLIIGPWVLAVARSEHGADALRALFWNNVVGRFTRIDSPAALDYTLGHRNAPGKYLFELPFYLLPWTPVVAAALVHAWGRVRESDAAGTAWRFALGASLPFLALLSLAATARDIYAAPAILGLAALAGLWSRDAERAPTRLDRLAVTGTRVLVAALAGVLLAALALLDPDETTIAVLDHGLDTRFTILTSDHDTSRAIVTRWFSDQGREARVLILVPGHARGALTRYLEHFHAPPPESDGVAGSLTASGAAALVRRYELPQGRRYALLGPPPPPP